MNKKQIDISDPKFIEAFAKADIKRLKRRIDIYFKSPQCYIDLYNSFIFCDEPIAYDRKDNCYYEINNPTKRWKFKGYRKSWDNYIKEYKNG